MNRTIADILDNLDHVGCDNETARELCEQVQRLQDDLDGDRLWIKEAKKLYDARGSHIDELRDALEHLVDEQNGPPLAKYARQWTQAMIVASKVLGRTKSEQFYQERLEELTCDGKTTTTTNPTPGSPTQETSPNTDKPDGSRSRNA
jgi:hypothetical protein